jgi:hypothetical protein
VCGCRQACAGSEKILSVQTKRQKNRKRLRFFCLLFFATSQPRAHACKVDPLPPVLFLNCWDTDFFCAWLPRAQNNMEAEAWVEAAAKSLNDTDGMHLVLPGDEQGRTMADQVTSRVLANTMPKFSDGNLVQKLVMTTEVTRKMYFCNIDQEVPERMRLVSRGGSSNLIELLPPLRVGFYCSGKRCVLVDPLPLTSEDITAMSHCFPSTFEKDSTGKTVIEIAVTLLILALEETSVPCAPARRKGYSRLNHAAGGGGAARALF